MTDIRGTSGETEEAPMGKNEKPKDRERWMARFQVRLAMQPGVDRPVVLRAVEEVTAHCADTGEEPQTAFGDPDAHAVRVAARLVPPERAARERRHDGVVEKLRSVTRRAGDIAGL
jgi:hypothetical protein